MEFRNKALLLGTPVDDRSCTSRTDEALARFHRRRRRSTVTAGRMSAADRYRKSLMRMRLFICRDFRHHGINENAKFSTKIFCTTAPPEENQLFSRRSRGAGAGASQW